MSGPKSVGRGLYWRSVFEQFSDSGLSVRRFCQENGISQSTFFAWRKRLSKETPLANSDRADASELSHGDKRSMKQPTPNPGMSFVAVKFPAEGKPIEVVHPLGYVVRVASGANLDVLARIFQILDQHATK